jgi:hypothetical protein
MSTVGSGSGDRYDEPFVPAPHSLPAAPAEALERRPTATSPPVPKTSLFAVGSSEVNDVPVPDSSGSDDEPLVSGTSATTAAPAVARESQPTGNERREGGPTPARCMFLGERFTGPPRTTPSPIPVSRLTPDSSSETDDVVIIDSSSDDEPDDVSRVPALSTVPAALAVRQVLTRTPARTASFGRTALLGVHST